MNGSQKKGHGQEHRHSRHDNHGSAQDDLLSEVPEKRAPESDPESHTHGTREGRVRRGEGG